MRARKWICYPYLVWMALFIIVPLILVVGYACTGTVDGKTVFTLEHFARFFQPIYLKVAGRSVLLALICTAICLVLGYPIAYILASREYSSRRILLFLFIMPMWMNFLLRTYSWLSLLETNGILNNFFALIGLGRQKLLYTNGAVILGMVYNFLPFMILPIHSCLKKMDYKLVEAAQDLGCDTANVFRRVILPLSIPGVVSGLTMVFMPAVTTFVISTLLGGGQFMLIGNLIEQQFLTVGNWAFGSAVSVIMMLIILLSMFVMSRVDKEETGGVM